MYSGPYNNPAYPPSNPYGPPGGYGAPGFGAPSYGAPGYGAPPSGYGAPGGYGVPPVPTGYNSDPYGMMPPGGGGYGAPPPMGGYGMNPPGMNPPGMMAPGGGGYGAPSYNAPGHSNYPPTGYGGGYGNVPPVSGGYASPPMGHPGAYPPAAPTGYNVPPVAAGGYPGGAHPPPGGYASTVTSTSMTTPVVAQTTTTTTTGMIPVIYMPIYTYPHSDPHTDATRLRKAMKGLGTDDSVLISIMTNRSKHQLQLIQEAYLREFKKSLEKDIIGDTSGNYQTLLCDLLRPVLAYKIESIKKAVRGLGTRESILIDVITQSSNAEIAQMKSQYPDIERDVSKDTSGNFRKVLLELLKGNRQETNVIDDSKAQAVAGELYKAGEMRLGTNDSKFVDIMTTYSPYFLDRVNLHYTRMYGNSLYKAIEKETSGDYCLALIACAKPPDAYFADRLKRAIRGLGTDDWGLIYVFALHDKAQLKHISKVYTDRGHGILPSDVERDTSGNYRKSLISLLA